jgi:DNA-binding transcriptional MerR regulator
MAQLDLLTTPTSRILPPPSDASLPAKASDAYRTISEVAEEIGVPQHVLRFWESNFPQVKPSRMRGARRYYRPEDVDLLRTIRSLLYDKGYTIKGAKQAMRGVKIPEAVVAPSMSASAPVASAAKPLPSKRNIDTKSLVSELRVLKSMLTSLL